MSNITTINPTTGEEIKSYEYMSDSEVNKIIDASHEAFLQWREKPTEERAKVISSISKKLGEYKEELAKLMTEERGKTYKHSLEEVDLCIAICDYTAQNGVAALADDERELEGLKKGIVTYQPIGIIYGIQPWNYPAYQVIRYTIANLMAGNSILLKHASNVTGSALLIEKILHDSELPNDLFRTLIISHDQSEQIIGNDKIRGVTLTGSDKAGAVVAQQAAKELKKTVMELGSNDAFIVLDDADLELAATTSAYARLYNNGETCVAAKRFVIVDSVYNKFRDLLIEKFKEYKVGDPMQESTNVGPMSSVKQRDTLKDQMQESIDKGAKVAYSSELDDSLSKDGAFHPLVILENITEEQPAYKDELFGPVAALIRAKDEEDAFRIANDSRYGLGGGVFSKDEDKAIRLASKYFDTGMVYINGYSLVNPGLPFGGVKNSGFGREHGGFGMKEFVNIKALHVVGQAPSK